MSTFSGASSAEIVEDSVIGCLLLNGKIIGELIPLVHLEDFVMEESKAVFQAAKTLFSLGKKVDATTILGQMGYSDAVNPKTQSARQYMFQCMEVTPNAANWQEYVQIMIEQSHVRQIRELAGKLVQVQTTKDAFALVGQAGEILGENPQVKITTMVEADEHFWERQEEKPQFVQWGIDRLDKTLHCEYGEFVLLAGRPSDGKTALALQMAFTMADTDRVGFFSYETGEGRLTDRLYANRASVSLTTIMQHNANKEELERLKNSSQRIRQAQLEWIEAAGFTVPEIFATAQARQYKIIFIDYLQKIQPSEDARSRYDIVTRVSSDLQQNAVNLHILTVALSQFSRAAAHGEPALSDLRESGQLEQDADTVLALSRATDADSHMPGDRKLAILKNKQGNLDSFVINFDGEHQQFIEYLPENF